MCAGAGKRRGSRFHQQHDCCPPTLGVQKSDFNWYGAANLMKLMAAKEMAARLQVG